MSAYPLLGKGTQRIPAQQVKLAMAIRSRNPHWRVSEILNRHWQAVAQRNLLGRSAEELISELIEATPRVIQEVSSALPADFPAAVADPILNGLSRAAEKLASSAA